MAILSTCPPGSRWFNDFPDGFIIQSIIISEIRFCCPDYCAAKAHMLRYLSCQCCFFRSTAISLEKQLTRSSPYRYNNKAISIRNSKFLEEVTYTMATNRNPRFKTSRRFGLNIYGHAKALKRQPAETRQKKMSEYGLQLTEKQKVKAMYNLLERQFYRYYDKARRMNGVLGTNLLVLLETRLDNLVYRAGFARSIRQARQMVNHGLINVDGKRVDIPSYPVKAGQVISLREGYRANEMFKQSFQELKTFDLPYIEKSFDNWSATLTRMPLREELPYKDEVNETLIVELYSK